MQFLWQDVQQIKLSNVLASMNFLNENVTHCIGFPKIDMELL